MKSQTIRLLDVLVIGPVMIRSGWHLRNRPIGGILTLFGIATIVYNLSNYLEKARFQNGY